MKNAGSLSKEKADKRSRDEYEVFAQRRREFLEAEGARNAIKGIEDIAKELPKK